MALMDIAAKRGKPPAPAEGQDEESTAADEMAADDAEEDRAEGEPQGDGDEAGDSRGMPPKDQQRGKGYTKPDIRQFVPPGAEDAVDRVVAAGMRLMYAPESREQLQEQIARQDAPVPQVLAENATGILLILFEQSKGTMPPEALVPAALELLGECAEVMSATGAEIDQQTYNDALLATIALVAKKAGAPDDQIAATLQGRAPAQGAPGGGRPPQQGQPPAVGRGAPPGLMGRAMMGA